MSWESYFDQQEEIAFNKWLDEVVITAIEFEPGKWGAMAWYPAEEWPEEWGLSTVGEDPERSTGDWEWTLDEILAEVFSY